MADGLWNWLILSDEGLLLRIAVGVAIFAMLAILDIRRRGPQAQRWREYLFLLTAVAVAIAYGVVNNLITAGISWEYFYYGKELGHALGPKAPPPVAPVRWQAAVMGFKAAWTAGLVFGVAFLLANNPRRNRPRLPYRRLYKLALVPLVAAAVCGALGGLAGYARLLEGLYPILKTLPAEGFLRPRRFMCVWGANLGGYAGGVVGTIAAVWGILRQRKRVACESAPPA